ncbi:DUF6221 family protein [Actinomadura madurae]|uniref:DUF6221 family protein n=1 Tax=Actinomadura madurae TaxID=1993 RepID=UPI0020D25214|nr:DUF6221 family protein [Actinomadura madurae]MCP9947244.1 DUF6221 family protein [Actinomadura madurae]MCP9964007.1 DUF6221 family protein [Actinomadura madurae]MCP9976483.1 DUF6221 family protein [Actinomadura madurae]MCQ0012024.1 DUF6221 family protein [Actinomadura madurae]MCQ0012675.1 DUF6221 family protein [Actinomadura madurae]
MIGLDRWVQFITARLDEDEQAARAALRADVCCWEHERLGGHDRLIEMYTYADGTEDSDVIAFFGADGLAEHTARHDPSRALREVEARRRTLARHTGKHVCPESPDEWHRYEGGERVDYMIPCADLRDLAGLWADHPDHPERTDES